MALFWNSIRNKMLIQQYFIDWMVEFQSHGSATVYVGGLQDGKCVVITDSNVTSVSELTSKHEEADDRIMMHISHACMDNIKSVLVYSADTDVLISLIYHYQINFTLEELYVMLGGTRSTKKTVPLHKLVKNLNPILIDCLPAVHALTGCDTTSRVGPKTAVLTKDVDLELIQLFGKGPQVTEEDIKNAEVFLLQILGQKEFKSFNEYRVHQHFDAQKNLTLDKIVCCSSTIALHVKRAYVQTNLWVNAEKKCFRNLTHLNLDTSTQKMGFTGRSWQQSQYVPMVSPIPAHAKRASRRPANAKWLDSNV